MLANSSKYLILLNLSAPVLQVIQSFLILNLNQKHDFVRNCQSVETVCKLTDVNQKRPHERLANGKSAINILMMSIYFHTFFYFLCFLITMLIIFSKAISGVIIFLVMSF